MFPTSAHTAIPKMPGSFPCDFCWSINPNAGITSAVYMVLQFSQFVFFSQWTAVLGNILDWEIFRVDVNTKKWDLKSNYLIVGTSMGLSFLK